MSYLEVTYRDIFKGTDGKSRSTSVGFESETAGSRHSMATG